MPALPQSFPIFRYLAGPDAETVVIDALGDLDYVSAAWFRRQMEQAWQPLRMRGLILNLEQVVFCDSLGLGELVALLRRCQGNGCRLILAGPNQDMIRLLTLTGLIGFFQVSADTTAAMATLLPQSFQLP